MAVSKAERAHDAAYEARVDFQNANRPLPCVEPGDVGEWADEGRAVLAKLAELQAVEDAAWQKARVTYDAAIGQGLSVHSNMFGYNATRELIAANID